MNPGDTISRYRILGPLGKGGMGIVYRAEDTRLNRPVALKFLPPDSLSDQDKHRFFNEAHAAAAARHPNICPIYDVEEVDGVAFIVMAYLDGETLHRKLMRGPLEIAHAIEIAIQVANGLECAHQLGIVHRDIKSANIIVSPDGHASILDFGLALVSGETRLTTGGQTVGTAYYMSPEQAQGQAVDRRTDLWSLGIVLFEMLTATLPFRREHTSAVLHAILNDPVPEIASLRAGVPPDVQRVIAKALARQPEQRWQTAAEMSRALKRIQTQGTSASDAELIPTQSMDAHSVPAPPRKRRAMVAVGAAFLILVTALGVYRFGEGRRASAPPFTALPLPQSKQVAVLPFQVIGSAESTRTVADGLVEILAAALSDFERFQGSITAIPSSEVRRRAIVSAEDARRIYGANLVITGSAQPSGDNVEFTLSLIDTVTLRQIGAKTFVYDVHNPVASRNRAVDVVVSLMKVDLAPATRTAIAAGDTAAPNAYSSYLKGRGMLARYDVAGNVDKAIATFTSAIQQDPNYALAYAGLGEAYWRKARNTGDKESAELARSNAEHAVQLDPDLALVHSVLGAVYRDAARDQDAIRQFQKAMQLAPGNAEAPRQLAEVYTNTGRFNEAEALYLQAVKSRPTDWYGFFVLGIFYYQRERYAESEQTILKAKALTPDNDMVSRNLGSIYRMHGRYREAVEELQYTLKIRSNAPTYAALAGAYFFEHRFAEAVSAGETALDLDSTDYRYWGNLGAYYKWAPGNEAKAPAALRRAIELGMKFQETRPTDYSVPANLAEYRARLGEVKESLAEIDKIPQAARKPLTPRLALAYELTGHRDRAIEVVRSNLTSPASLTQIKDDPDLAALWKDAAFQKAILTPAKGSAL